MEQANLKEMAFLTQGELKRIFEFFMNFLENSKNKRIRKESNLTSSFTAVRREGKFVFFADFFFFNESKSSREGDLYIRYDGALVLSLSIKNGKIIQSFFSAKIDWQKKILKFLE